VVCLSLSIVQIVEGWTVCTPLSVNVFVALGTLTFGIPLQALFETPCIPSGSHIEPQLSQVKLSVLLHYDSSKHCTCPLNKHIYGWTILSQVCLSFEYRQLACHQMR
jgi:hypothetical protein